MFPAGVGGSRRELVSRSIDAAGVNVSAAGREAGEQCTSLRHSAERLASFAAAVLAATSSASSLLCSLLCSLLSRALQVASCSLKFSTADKCRC